MVKSSRADTLHFTETRILLVPLQRTQTCLIWDCEFFICLPNRVSLFATVYVSLRVIFMICSVAGQWRNYSSPGLSYWKLCFPFYFYFYQKLKENSSDGFSFHWLTGFSSPSPFCNSCCLPKNNLFALRQFNAYWLPEAELPLALLQG